MKFTRKHYAAGLIPLALIEVSSLYHQWGWLSWGYPSWLALSNAIAFMAFMLGSIVSMGLPLETKYRRRVYLSGLALILCIALANILGVLQVGMGYDQIDSMIYMTGWPHHIAVGTTAVLQGGLLTLVSVSTWGILSKMVEHRWDRERQQQEVLREIAAKHREEREEATK